MKNHNQILLIEGMFKPEEAREILTNLLSAKIRFHQLKNLSSIEKNGTDDPVSKARIPELEESLEKVISLIANAANNHTALKIHSEIAIEFINSEN